MAHWTISGITRVTAILMAAAWAWGGQTDDTPAAKWKFHVSSGSGQVTFTAIGKPSMLKIRGKGPLPTGELSVEGGQVSGALSFELSALDTGIATRDRHLKENYLEVEKFPKARFLFTEMKAPDGLGSEGLSVEDVAFKGKLALHGLEREVEGKARLAGKPDGKLEIEAGFQAKTGDFGIATPKFMNIVVAETIDVKIEITAPLTKE